ncbi:MAG: purine-nucleoside phosphorylase [Deltaproteobacteria bacterium]|nr:purine-nucleoside phosphorylase [Deltaproteobacteria bacterium]MBI3296311.1 purine-nucleoside phosphorylase [Deltaproteobacteria bacterium]
MNVLSRIAEAQRAIAARVKNFPEIVLVTGSGLAGLVDTLSREIEIPFGEIPHLRSSTVQGHPGRLVIGRLGQTRLAVMHGRLHYYEGYSMEDVVFPFRVLARLGASVFVLTNAAGALHTSIQPTDLVLLTDHINLMGTNPLVGKNYDELGVRFPDMSHLYDPDLCEKVRASAERTGVPLREGIYVGLHGPSYETPAEIRMYRMLGGDVVGMSTVPEAIALHHMGKRVVGISCVTNYAAGVSPAPLVHDEVLENGRKAYHNFSSLLSDFVDNLGRSHG